MQESFPISEGVAERVGRRGDEDGVVEGVAADPIRTRTQVPRRPVLPPNPGKETLVHLPQQTDRQRKAVPEAGQPVFHGGHVVGHFPRVVGLLRVDVAGLEPEQRRDVGLGALDPGAQDRLKAEVRSDEQVRVRDQPTDTSEAVHRASRLVQEDQEFG